MIISLLNPAVNLHVDEPPSKAARHPSQAVPVGNTFYPQAQARKPLVPRVFMHSAGCQGRIGMNDTVIIEESLLVRIKEVEGLMRDNASWLQPSEADPLKDYYKLVYAEMLLLYLEVIGQSAPRLTSKNINVGDVKSRAETTLEAIRNVLLIVWQQVSPNAPEYRNELLEIQKATEAHINQKELSLEDRARTLDRLARAQRLYAVLAQYDRYIDSSIGGESSPMKSSYTPSGSLVDRLQDLHPDRSVVLEHLRESLPRDSYHRQSVADLVSALTLARVDEASFIWGGWLLRAPVGTELPINLIVARYREVMGNAELKQGLEDVNALRSLFFLELQENLAQFGLSEGFKTSMLPTDDALKQAKGKYPHLLRTDTRQERQHPYVEVKRGVREFRVIPGRR